MSGRRVCIPRGLNLKKKKGFIIKISLLEELNLVQGGSKTTTTEPSNQDNTIVHYPIGKTDESQQTNTNAPRRGFLNISKLEYHYFS